MKIVISKWCFIIALCLISLAWLLPNHYVPWLTSHSDFSAFLSLICFSLGLILLLEKISIPKFSIILLCIALIAIAQFLLGKIFFFGDAFIAFLYIIGFFVTFIFGFNVPIDKKKSFYLYFYGIIVIVGIISIYIQLKQWLLLTNGGIWIVDLPSHARPFANFAQPNSCSTFLLMALIGSLYLYEKEYINKISGILIATFILFGVALTQSRTAWVFFFAFIIWWLWKTNYFSTRLKRWSVFYFIGIYICFIIALPYISNYLSLSNTSDILTRVTTGHLRIPMWNQMLLAIKNEPLWGYGWNQVSVAQITVFLEYPTTEWVEHSHNILLDLLIWNGIPLGLFIIGFLGWWLYCISKLATSVESFIALSMVGAVLVHAMLEFPLDYAFFLLPVAFLLGLVQAEDENLKVINIQRGLMGLFLTILIALYIWIFIEYRIIEKDVQLLRFESLNIGTLHADHAAPKVILLTQLREQTRFIRTPPIKNMSQEQLNWMRHVTYRFATSAALYRYAQALAMNNQPVLAKKYLLIIEKLYGKKYNFESLFQVNKSLAFEWQNKGASK